MWAHAKKFVQKDRLLQHIVRVLLKYFTAVPVFPPTAAYARLLAAYFERLFMASSRFRPGGIPW